MLEPGFHRGVSKADYLADPTATPSLSASIAKLLVGRSPSHAWSAHPKGGRFNRAPSEAMINGSLLDSLLLGGDTEIVESPYEEYRTKEAREWRDAQAKAGKLPMKAKDLRQARGAADIIRENLARDGVQLVGENQLTVIWREDTSGVSDVGVVECKARLDHWREDLLTVYDLKIVDCAHPDAVARKMVDFGWDIQAAAYVRAVEAVRPEWAGRVQMVFLFAEGEPPHETLVRPLAGTMRALGEWKWERAVRLWGECLRARRWPGYSGMEQGIEAPAWALAKMEEGLAGGSDGISF